MNEQEWVQTLVERLTETGSTKEWSMFFNLINEEVQQYTDFCPRQSNASSQETIWSARKDLSVIRR